MAERLLLGQRPLGLASCPRPSHQLYRCNGGNGRRLALETRASSGGPAYNKYRSRQDVEQDYYKQWEKTTLVAEQQPHQLTMLTLLQFLPTWFKFYVVPGPVRFVWYGIWQSLLRVAHRVNKRLVLQGAKLDVALSRRTNPHATVERKLALLRLHGKLSLWQDLLYRLHLLQGKPYQPLLKQRVE